MDIIYKELSYKIIGAAYEVFNAFGYGLKEKSYAAGLENILKNDNISYKREVYYPLKVRDSVVDRRFFDFLIEDKVVVELKVGSDRYFNAYHQLLDYLKASNLKLGIIIRFTKDGVKIKRIPNIF